MALPMDEQRMLDEIEHRLADEDPVLAARLTAFGPPGLGITLRSRRGRMLASLIALVTLAVISVAAYALMPLATHHAAKPRPAPSSSQPASAASTGASGQPATPGHPVARTQHSPPGPATARSGPTVSIPGQAQP
jgi:Protein of unknown function (DUF3040)